MIILARVLAGAVLVISTLCALGGIALIVRDRRRYRAFPHFPTHPQLASGPRMPADQSISIIVPARNEERAIARCVTGALGQATPRRIEVIVIDDGSTDRTPDIVSGVAARHTGANPALRLVPGRPLPPGWVGKCNACAHGAAQAMGDWLLFIDADTAPGPDLVEAALAHAHAGRLDALSGMPFQELVTFGERLVIPAFSHLIVTVLPLPRIADPDGPPDQALANGQCILVRRDAYEAVGGHGAVRASLLEDVHLARMLRRAGFRFALASATEHIRTRMYHDFAEIVEGFGKNARAGTRVNVTRTMVGTGEILLTTLLPPLAAAGLIAAALATRDASVAAAAAMAVAWWAASICFWGGLLRRQFRLPAWLGTLMPLGLTLYMLIAARGLLLSASPRGVRWKGRDYEAQ